MTRRTSAVVAEQNATGQERIEAMKADHPFGGSRCVWAHLRFTEGMVVNRKRVFPPDA